MDRCALFVDAGYLLVAGSWIHAKSRSRSDASCRYGPLVDQLAARAAQDCSLPVLRTYWYDAAQDAVPSQDQQNIARLPNLKLRLGRLVGQRQKGVDALIVRDLMVLSRGGGVSTAYVVTGDDDILEGVIAAQEQGVQVNVISFVTDPPNVAGIASTLIHEADGWLELPASEFLSPYFFQPPSVEQEPSGEETTPTEDASEDDETTEGPAPTMDDARIAGQSFARDWIKGGHSDDILALLDAKPVIPRHVDAALLSSAETAVGALRPANEKQALRKAVRDGFWEAIQKLTGKD